MTTPAPRAAQRELAAETASITVGRHWVRAEAGRWLTDRARLADVELAVSELLTNAVEHGRGQVIRLACTATADELVVEVASVLAPPVPTSIPVPVGQRSGRGLLIVATVSDLVSIGGAPPEVVVRCTFAR